MSSIRLMGLVVGLLLWSTASSFHGHFTDHYRSAAGSPCCGVHDCRIVSLRVLRTIGEEVVVLEIAGRFVIELPRGSVHASEDGHDWWCALNPAMEPTTSNTRCVFIAVGS